MTNTNDDSASDCNLSDNGNKADGFYALGIVPVLKNKVSIKARYDLYRNNGEWNSAQKPSTKQAPITISSKI